MTQTKTKINRPRIDGDQCYITAEIGINHNGDLNIARKLILAAVGVGCDAVKFQKRTVDVVYTPDELARSRENPFGPTNGDLKRGLEFSKDEYDEIDGYCREHGIDWYASPWDEGSVDFLMQYDCPYIKIASASATDKDLLRYCVATGRPLLISTGMCDADMVRRIVHTVLDWGGEIACLYHCVSTYPANENELNLLAIKTLMDEFPELSIGYSGHEVALAPTLMAAVLGAAAVERHITLGRAMWGSDHAASVEPHGLARLVRDIRAWEAARGDGVKRIFDAELPVAEKLRRKNTI